MESTTNETEEPPPVAEPDYTKANKLLFSDVCKKLEVLWKHRSKRSGKQGKEELLKYLLPPNLSRYFAGSEGQSNSPFPLFRLLMPDIDTTRPHSGMKEATIATVWAEALGFSKGTSPYMKLTHYKDPAHAGPTAKGDLSVALREVLEDRFPYPPSKVTIGQVNDLLDELANLRGKKSSAGHEWRTNGGGSKRKPEKGATKKEKQVQWVRKLLELEMSPLEHKWISRILLQKLEMGVGSMSILKYYSPWAEEVHNANNSLKRLCATISDPGWVKRRQEQEAIAKQLMQEGQRENYMPRSKAQASFGNTIAPMLSQKTSFSKALSDITARHREYAKTLSSDGVGASSLALKFPAFVCEVKIDGERMITHVQRGVVTMQTRNSKWYSPQYSPVLGPAIRRAIESYDVDVILDGEVISWDDCKKEIIAFGNNRTVAKSRREYLSRHGMIDKIDLNLHENEQDKTVIWAAPDSNEPTYNDEEHEEGAECWLKYVVFDILYVGGPDASRLISQCVSRHTSYTTGSILDLNLIERKRILYRLFEPQENQATLVSSAVVRPNGTTMNAEDYFSPTNPPCEGGNLSSTVDSIECALRGDLTNLSEIDIDLRAGRSDTEINSRRVGAMEHFYEEVVEKRCQEGLVFKDLASPYVLGTASRTLGYWWKLKPDYNQTGHAADVDVVVLGGSFATGLGRAGILNQLLVGCVDPSSGNPVKYMTLANVNGGSTPREQMDLLLKTTGFRAASSTEELSYGKWYKETDHTLPDFLSARSFQRSRRGDDNGWSFTRDSYPGLWINPEDSVVLTINSGEIIASDKFSAGVSLRFPRISRVRLGADAKEAEECESVDELHRLYEERANQAAASGDINLPSGSPLRRKTASTRRFLTYEELSKRKRQAPARKKTSSEHLALLIPKVNRVKSTALQGLTFAVLEGTFFLEENSLDAEEAKQQNWYEEASMVRSREDVMKFIAEHSGTCMLITGTKTNYTLGGRHDDARVSNYRRALADATSDDIGGRSKSAKDLQDVLGNGGVLKWTFVYALINRWKQQKHLSASWKEQGIIKENAPHLLKLKRHDFLVISPFADEALESDDVFGIELNGEINMIDLKRGFNEIRASSRNNTQGISDDPAAPLKKLKFAKRLNSTATSTGPSHVPWQYAAFEELERDDRWVMAGPHQFAWPYRSPNNKGCLQSNDEPAVLYPHYFKSGFGLSDRAEAQKEVLNGIKSSRWDDVSLDLKLSTVGSSLPLARVMGFQVTCHLHSGVSHVLCGFLRDRTSLVWKADLHLESFSQEQTAKDLHQRLLSLHQESLRHEMHRVLLVSPQWIHDNWE